MNCDELKYGDLFVFGQGGYLQVGIFKKKSDNIQYYQLSDRGYKAFRAERFGELLRRTHIVYKSSMKDGKFKYKGVEYKEGDRYEFQYKPAIDWCTIKKYRNIMKITPESLNEMELELYNKFKKDLAECR